VPEACNVGAHRRRDPSIVERGLGEEPPQVEVRIGITHTAKELEIELAEDADRDTIIADVEAALGRREGVLWLTDRRGRRVGISAAQVAYVEVGAPANERRVGFGAP
jgi:hypothetical protein